MGMNGGKDLQKLSKIHLANIKFVDMINHLLVEKIVHLGTTPPDIIWELIKMEVIDASTKWSIDQAKELKENLFQLTAQLKALKEKIKCEGLSELDEQAKLLQQEIGTQVAQKTKVLFLDLNVNGMMKGKKFKNFL